MISALLTGVLLAIGAIVVRRSLQKPTLEVELSKFSGVDGTSMTDPRPSWLRILRADDRDLAVTGVTSARYTTDQLTCAAVACSTPIGMYAVLRVGGISVPIMVVMLGCVSAGALGLQLPRLSLANRARAARRDFRSSLSSYLDLVSMMISGGAGIETALVAAARVGDGPTYALITDALDVARSTRRSPWDVLSESGRRIGVDELPELASTIKLGGEQGARMTASLMAKATSLRHKQMAEIEAAANASTERMGLPMVLMFVAFLVLLGFPAVHLIGQGFG